MIQVSKKTYLQILSHLLHAREVVNRESRILKHIHREHGFTTPLHLRILEPLRESLQSHPFHHLLHHNLNENTTTTHRLR